jgi:hypothetical protein
MHNYEPIKAFLETEKVDKNKFLFLQRDKISNIQTLRVFNGAEGPDYNGPLDGTDDLFNSKQWKKVYKKYAEDTIIKYWKKEDFDEYNFTLENSKLIFSEAFDKKHPADFLNIDIIFLTEPLYYYNKKYVLFYYDKDFRYGSNYPRVIVMKKENKKWVVVRTIVEYIYH